MTLYLPDGKELCTYQYFGLVIEFMDVHVCKNWHHRNNILWWNRSFKRLSFERQRIFVEIEHSLGVGICIYFENNFLCLVNLDLKNFFPESPGNFFLDHKIVFCIK